MLKITWETDEDHWRKHCRFLLNSAANTSDEIETAINKIVRSIQTELNLAFSSGRDFQRAFNEKKYENGN